MSILYQSFFEFSAAELTQIPVSTRPEVCFVGRSNAGKSSAINALTNQTRLAFSSKTPGRTQLMNFFAVPDSSRTPIGYLVDLPGYGYASVAQRDIQRWQNTLSKYVTERPNLIGIVLMLDIRHGITKNDQLLLDFLQPAQKPLLILLTKADKLSYSRRLAALAALEKQLSSLPIESRCVAFSSTQKIGLDTASAHIIQWLKDHPTITLP